MLANSCCRWRSGVSPGGFPGWFIGDTLGTQPNAGGAEPLLALHPRAAWLGTQPIIGSGGHATPKC